MHEIEFQSEVIKALKQFPNTYILNTCMRYSIGVPDLLIGLNGKFIAIELKVGKNNRHSIQSLFPKSRKQIPTLYDIEMGNNKAYGLILFVQAQKIMLFRINFKSFPIDNPDNLKLINQLILSPFNDTYNEMLECYIIDSVNLNQLRSFLL
jgi:hypothetical protein